MKAAVVGVGRMGRRHVEILTNLGMEVVALIDRDRDVAAGAATDYSLPRDVVFDDFETALRTTRPEAVVISTTAPTHCAFVTAAAQNGVGYILCEKPLAVSLAEAELMVETCERAGALLAVNHQMRFMPQYTEVKRLAASPELGGITSILVAAANFGVSMNGSHYFEMFRFMMDETAIAVQAWFEPDLLANPRGPSFQDRSGQMRVEAASGRSMYMDLSGKAGHGLQVTYICRYGQIVIDELSGYARLIRRKDEYRDLPTTRYGMPAVEEQFRISPADVIASTQAVWRAMLAHDDYPGGDIGLHTMQCLVAAHASAESGGRRVDLTGSLDTQRVFTWA